MGPGRIEQERVGSVAVVVVHGEHDLHTAGLLRERLEAAEGAIVLDLSDASFIDSSVIRVMLEARGQAHDRGTGFAVALADGADPGVRRVLEVTGLIERLPVMDDRDAAIEVARPGGAG